jgi:hypothetical protein
MDKIYKVVGTGEKFGKLVCVSCKKNLLVSFVYLLDNICAILSVSQNPTRHTPKATGAALATSAVIAAGVLESQQVLPIWHTRNVTFTMWMLLP